MIPFPAMRVLTATGARQVGRPPFQDFLSVSTDTRTIGDGALFVALRGERFDGHDFLRQALENGALAAVVDEEGARRAPEGLPLYIVRDTLKAYGDLAAAYRRQFSVPVIGVTGSFGKTTTKDLIAAALRRLGPVVATAENYNNEVGVPQTLFRLGNDTRAAVIEMGMRGPGQIRSLARVVVPTGAVITGIGKTHSEFFPGGEEGVADAKAELLDEMQAGAPVALPADSRWAMLLQRRARGPVTTFGFAAGADVRAADYRLDDGRASFRLVTRDTSVSLRLTAPGRHLAQDAAAAMAVALWLGIPAAEAADAMAEAPLGRHRLNVHRLPGGRTVIDDCYNAGPESVRAALEVLRDWPAQRRVLVLGDMRELGDAAEEEHRALASETAAFDRIITVGDLSRLVSEGHPNGAHFGDAGAAAETVVREISDGDVVLVKGSRALELEKVVSALVEGL
jgi:UDP-N-acetylmuramoyl-tripeptide--D-alanyl-D-alanine ligase